MRTLGSIQYLAPAGDPWQDMPALWQGEGFVQGASRHALHRATGHSASAGDPQCQRSEPISSVLTGYLPRPIDPVDAVSPVAARASMTRAGCASIAARPCATPARRCAAPSCTRTSALPPRPSFRR